MDNVADETELWARARQNDGDAFGALFDLHRDRVYRRALGLLGKAHDAEEVSSAAFFELWRKRNSVRLVGGSVLPWLLVTTVNLARNSHRSTARYRNVLRSLPIGEARDDSFSESFETNERLGTAIRALSPVDGALFVLTVLDELSTDEAAEVVGLKPSTARVRLHRARHRLKLELGDIQPTNRSALEGNQL